MNTSGLERAFNRLKQTALSEWAEYERAIGSIHSNHKTHDDDPMLASGLITAGAHLVKAGTAIRGMLALRDLNAKFERQGGES